MAGNLCRALAVIAVIGLSVSDSNAAQRAKPRRAVAAPKARAAALKPKEQGQDLLELIQNTVAPDTWEIRGGRGTIHYFGLPQATNDGQASQGQQDLAELLRAIHGD